MLSKKMMGHNIRNLVQVKDDEPSVLLTYIEGCLRNKNSVLEKNSSVCQLLLFCNAMRPQVQPVLIEGKIQAQKIQHFNS